MKLRYIKAINNLLSKQFKIYDSDGNLVICGVTNISKDLPFGKYTLVQKCDKWSHFYIKF